jgi:hypothetical protein
VPEYSAPATSLNKVSALGAWLTSAAKKDWGIRGKNFCLLNA